MPKPTLLRSAFAHTLAIASGPLLTRGERVQLRAARALEAAGLVTLRDGVLPAALALELTEVGRREAVVLRAQLGLSFSSPKNTVRQASYHVFAR